MYRMASFHTFPYALDSPLNDSHTAYIYESDVNKEKGW